MLKYTEHFIECPASPEKLAQTEIEMTPPCLCAIVEEAHTNRIRKTQKFAEGMAERLEERAKTEGVEDYRTIAQTYWIIYNYLEDQF